MSFFNNHLWWIATITCINLFAFFVFAFDKIMARSGRRRVSERNLLLLCLIGGWFGAWWAQSLWRHKTQKKSFRWRFYLCTLINITAFAIFWWVK